MDNNNEKNNPSLEMDFGPIIDELNKMADKLNQLEQEMKEEGLNFNTRSDERVKF